MGEVGSILVTFFYSHLYYIMTKGIWEIVMRATITIIYFMW